MKGINVDYSLIFLCIVIVFTLFSSNFLSFSEAAIMSLNKNKFKIYKHENPKKINVKILDRILAKKQNYITAIIILNTMVNIGGSIVIGGLATPIFTNVTGLVINFSLFDNTKYEFLVDFAITANALFTMFFTLGILYISEMIPKLIAAQNPLSISLFISVPLFLLEIPIKPIVWLSLKICSFFVEDVDNSSICIVEVKTMVNEAYEQGLIKDREMDIINNTFSLSDKVVKDLMRVKTDIEYLNANTNILEDREEIINLQHKRIIITEGFSNEKPIGVVVVKDLLKGILLNEDKKAIDYIHKLLIVDENTPLATILADFNDTSDHLALVQCKDGSFKGVIAVEDILDSLSIGFPD